MPELSVIICCHDPDPMILNRVIASLKRQTFDISKWELIVVDNGSRHPVQNYLDISWHPQGRFVHERKLGLVHARIKGTLAAKNEILATVDDDTILFPDYLEVIASTYDMYPEMGVIGGKSIAEYETTPPDWFRGFSGLLAIRDLGDDVLIETKREKITHYPECAPLLIAPRRKCMLEYIQHYKNDARSQQLGRKGTSLLSGEDNDINLFIYKGGHALGYFPALKFIHYIPKERYTLAYLERMAYQSNISWMKVLDIHQINPYRKIGKWTVLPRQIRAWFRLKAWKNEINRIKWKGACGLFKGLSEL